MPLKTAALPRFAKLACEIESEHSPTVLGASKQYCQLGFVVASAAVLMCPTHHKSFFQT